MSLYNLRSTEREATYLFTKFDDDLNIVDDAIYETSLSECTCPAGHRPSCRHRQMLNNFLATDRTDTDWFFCFETGQWSQPFEPLEDIEPTVPAPPESSNIDMSGITIVSLDSVADVHNKIAGAVGEPKLQPRNALRRL